MRKTILSLVGAALVVVSCDNGGAANTTSNITLNNEVDSVSHAIGVLLAENIKKEIENLKQTDSMNVDLLKSTIKSALDEAEMKMDVNASQELIQAYFNKKMEDRFGDVIQDGENYFNEFTAQEDVIVTDSGLAYKYLKKGSGKNPGPQDKVSCKYTGTFVDGVAFDSSGDKAVEFGVYQVIPGWTEMLQLMKEGDKVKVVIPYDMAYGTQGNQGIPPYSTLVFEMELVKVL